MRSKVLPRAGFFRIVAQQSSSSGGTSSATTARPLHAARRAALANAARKRQETKASTTSSSSASGSNSTVASSGGGGRRRRSISKRATADQHHGFFQQSFPPHPFLDAIRRQHKKAAAAAESIPPSAAIAHGRSPPQHSLRSLQMDMLCAGHRPLLEHAAVEENRTSSSQDNAPTPLQVVEGIKSVLRMFEEASQAKSSNGGKAAKNGSITHMVQQTLERAERDGGGEIKVFIVPSQSSSSAEPMPKRVRNIDQQRFEQLFDRVTGVKRKDNDDADQKELVRSVAASLEDDSRHRADVEEAVRNMTERGEDPSVAQALGSEADLIILGEPEGPNPAWPRGVATYMAQMSQRAFMPPAATQAERDADAAGLWTGARHEIMSGERDDDVTHVLSRAALQASLPNALLWDRVVRQMDAVTLGEPVKEGVDLTTLNADMTAHDFAFDEYEDEHARSVAHAISAADANGGGGGVQMDSTRRKRIKKMRKHQYKKLRKRTRVERNKLKKG